MRNKNAIVTRLLAGLVGVLLGSLFLATPAAQSVSVQIQVAINQLTTGVTPFTFARVAPNGYLNFGNVTGVNGYGLRDLGGLVQLKQSGAPGWTTIDPTGMGDLDASYITRVTETGLTNETALANLTSGLLLNTTGTGLPTIYTGTSCTDTFPRSLSALGVATCAAVNIVTDTTGTLTVARGGTGLTSGTSGGIPYYSSSSAITSSALLATSQVLLGGGAGGAPTSLGSLGTTTTLLHGNAAGAPTFGAVVLTTDVSGILPTANGGTANAFFTVSGPATSAKTFTFPNSSSTVLTSNAAVTAVQGGTGHTVYAVGDLLQANTTTTLARLAAVSTGNALISGGVGVVSTWGKIGLTTHVTGVLPVANGGTGLASYVVGDLIYASGTTTLATRAAVAAGQVLISAGVATPPVWSATPTVTTLRANTSYLLGATPTFFAAAPTISSGFGTTPAVVMGSTATSMRIDVGTGGTANSGVIGMPTATTGWNCHVENQTGVAANTADERTVQTASTTTTVTVENQTVSTGVVAAWDMNDILVLVCAAF